MSEEACARCAGSGIDPELSLPMEGPTYYSMGEPPVLEPCVECQWEAYRDSKDER